MDTCSICQTACLVGNQICFSFICTTLSLTSRLYNFFLAQFQLLIKTEIPTNKNVLALSHSDAVFIMLINV